MKRRFPRIRTIEPDRAVGFGPREAHRSPAGGARHTLRLRDRIDAVKRAAPATLYCVPRYNWCAMLRHAGPDIPHQAEARMTADERLALPG